MSAEVEGLRAFIAAVYRDDQPVHPKWHSAWDQPEYAEIKAEAHAAYVQSFADKREAERLAYVCPWCRQGSHDECLVHVGAHCACPCARVSA